MFDATAQKPCPIEEVQTLCNRQSWCTKKVRDKNLEKPRVLSPGLINIPGSRDLCVPLMRMLLKVGDIDAPSHETSNDE